MRRGREEGAVNSDVGRITISEGEAAEALGLSHRTLQRWRVTGEGPTFVKLGRRVRYRPADLEAFVEESRRSSTSVM